MNTEFTPPSISAGMQVIWYRHGVRRESDSIVGFMLHKGRRTSQIFLINGRRVDAVRHIDDPKLQLNADQREAGAWDFTEGHKDYIEHRQKTEARLDQIEKDISKLIVSSGVRRAKPSVAAAGKENLHKYQVLKSQVLELGLYVKGMKKAEMELALRQYQSQKPLVLNETS